MLGGHEIDADQCGNPPFCQIVQTIDPPNSSFNVRDAGRQNVCTGAHPATIQSPSGNDSRHPPGHHYKGPYNQFPPPLRRSRTKIFPA